MLRILVRRYRPATGLALLVVALVLTWAGEGSVAWAERKSSVGQGGVASNRLAGGQQPSRSSAPVQTDVGISPKQRVGKSSSLEKGKGPAKEPSARRAHRRARVAKPLSPQATLTPKPDVSFHGMLQQPQRYTPHYEHGKGGVPNPNAGALLHEHFQELDKNRDGSIDPFERALGRLDLDRDLADHQWQ
ncbi:MAG: EF-hand domain-containing protein [Nitrospirota bacterium]